MINSLRRLFATYGIPEELASDGVSEYTAPKTQKFLSNRGVHHRNSSVAYPHSNCRAELGVKTIKRMIKSNVGPDGSLDVDTFQRAILQYRNTPDQHTKLSPAMILFGRAIRDFIPVLPGKYRPHNTWREMLEEREMALRNRHMKDCERLSEHTKSLPPLVIGDYVRLQNQHGNHPKKWDKTGVVVEVKQFDQYVIRVDGSGRATLRNRQFLRKYTPAISKTALRVNVPPLTPAYSPTTHNVVPPPPSTTKPPANPSATTAPAGKPVVENLSTHPTAVETTPEHSAEVILPNTQVVENQPDITPGIPVDSNVPSTTNTEMERLISTPPPIRKSSRHNKAKLQSHFEGFEMK